MSETKKEDIKEETKENETIEASVAETPNKTANTRRIILLVVLLVVVALLAVFVFWYMDENNKEIKKVTVTTTTKSCGTLTAEDGKMEGLAPFKPIMVGKVTNNEPNKVMYCSWTSDGKDLGRTILADGKCTLGGLSFYTTGNHQVSYRVYDLNCKTEARINVTGMTEEQKANQIKEKTSGVLPGDL